MGPDERADLERNFEKVIREIEALKKREPIVTRRDLFAAAALSGLLSRPAQHGSCYSEEFAIRRSWELADEMEAKRGSPR